MGGLGDYWHTTKLVENLGHKQGYVTYVTCIKINKCKQGYKNGCTDLK